MPDPNKLLCRIQILDYKIEYRDYSFVWKLSPIASQFQNYFLSNKTNAPISGGRILLLVVPSCYRILGCKIIYLGPTQLILGSLYH